MSNNAYQRYLLHIRFDGSKYAGWQRQKNDAQETVEQKVEEALSRLFQIKDIDVIGHGRTDAGVHALDQCAHVDLPTHFEIQRLKKALNSLLPEDIRIGGIDTITSDTHARFDAISRTYEYYISIVENPILRHQSLFYGYTLNLDKMIEAASIFIGTHDFGAFCIQSDDLPHKKCTIHESQFIWSEDRELLKYRVTGNRFLRRMVRRLVGSLLMLGRGKYETEELIQWLKAGVAPLPDIYTAPAYPLHLCTVQYPDHIFI